MGKQAAKHLPAKRRTQAARTRSQVGIICGGVIASLLVLGIGVGNVAQAHTEVTLEVDGISVPVTAWGNTSADILSAAGVEVTEKDLVLPQPDQRVSDGDTVIVRTAHPFEVTINGQQRTIWSTSTSVDAVLADASATGTVSMPADRSATRAELLALVSSDRAVSVKVGQSEVAQVHVRAGEDVRTALDRAGVELSANDQVALHVSGGAVEIVVDRVTRGVTTAAVPVAFDTEKQESDELFQGESVVITKGEMGEQVQTSWTETRNGVITFTSQISNEVTQEPVTEVVKEGTKEPTREALIAAGLDPESEPVQTEQEDGTIAVTYEKLEPTEAAALQVAGVPTTYSGEDPRSLAKPLVTEKGWDDTEFQCLVTLWNHESGWNPYAANPSSSAYGIPQALPGSKMATAGDDWLTNPVTQIKWGLGYIAGRYGTPCGALSHWTNSNWY